MVLSTLVYISLVKENLPYQELKETFGELELLIEWDVVVGLTGRLWLVGVLSLCSSPMLGISFITHTADGQLPCRLRCS